MTLHVTESATRLAYSERDLDALGVLSRKTRWRMRREGLFPEPVQAGGRKLYKAHEIIEWLENPARWAEAQKQIRSASRS